MKLCYIGRSFLPSGVRSIVENDVDALRSVGCDVQVPKLSVYDEFEVQSVNSDVDAIICTDVYAAMKIKDVKSLRRKTLLFVRGRMDDNLDPDPAISYWPLKFALFLDRIDLSKMVFLESLRRILVERLLHVYGDKYENVHKSIYEAITSFSPVYVSSASWGDLVKKCFGVDYVKVPLGLDKSYWRRDRPYETGSEKVRVIVPTGLFKCKKLDYGLAKINSVTSRLKDLIDTCDFLWYNNDYRSLKDDLHERYPNINFVTDATADPKALFQQYDLVIHPSLGESFSRIVLECLSIGLPCLVSSVSEDILGDHVLCVDPRSQLYDSALDKLITKPNLRMDLSRKASEFARKWMSWQDRAQMIIDEVKRKELA